MSSTTRPITADAIIVVPVLRSMPNAPIMPPVQMIGMTLGITATATMRHERNSAPMARNTRPIAQPKLRTCELTSELESSATR